jgi:hypothetical protein
LHLGIFEQPAENDFFMLTARRFRRLDVPEEVIITRHFAVYEWVPGKTINFPKFWKKDGKAQFWFLTTKFGQKPSKILTKKNGYDTRNRIRKKTL